MDLIKCLIKNLKISEDKTASRLIKFRKADDAKFQIPPVFSSVATSSDGFNICLAPVILPEFCENAINHVGFDYYRRIDGITFELKNRVTDEVIASGSAREYWDVIDKVNTSSVVSARGLDNGDGNSGIILQNTTNEDLQLLFTLYVPEDSEDSAGVYQNYQDDYYNEVEQNPTYNQIDDNSFEVCLSPSACSTEIKTLTLKKPTADLREHSIVINYRVESSGFTEEFTSTLVYSDDYNNPLSTTYNVDYAETVCRNISNRFEQYSNITYINSQPENGITPVNNCIDNRGDVQFELRLNGFDTSTNPIDLIITEDRGLTLIKVSTPGTSDKNAALNNLASQLVAYGYTSVAPANNAKITLKRSDVRSLCVITDGYVSHSFSVNNADWGYDGNFAVDGVYRDNVAVRPISCTLGLKDPYRNFENYTLTFKGYPLKGPYPINFTKVTITPTNPELLEENQIDFLTTFTDLDTFSFETCETYFRPPS